MKKERVVSRARHLVPPVCEARANEGKSWSEKFLRREEADPEAATVTVLRMYPRGGAAKDPGRGEILPAPRPDASGA